MVLVCVLIVATQNTHSTCKVRLFLWNEDILAGLHNYEGLFEG